PDGKGDVTPLRARVATVAASALTVVPSAPTDTTWTGHDFGPNGPPPPPQPHPAVLAGIDVLRNQGFALLKGKHIGLLTNPTRRTRDGSATIDVLREAKD